VGPLAGVKVSAPAKINLFLRVLGRREDGYHELRTLMCCVGLHDTLVIHMGTPGDSLTCSDARIPCGEDNLALKAALLFNRALAAETAIAPLNVSIELIKRIPSGAGLGGGSSDAAAVLNHLNRYYHYPLKDEKLHALALSLGADVPFFIQGRPALASGIGELLEPYAGLSPWGAVVVYPGFGISTAEVFKNLNLGLTKCEKQLRYFPFKYGKFDIVRHLCNDLETVAAHRFPVIETIKKELLNQGAMGSLMTGSGSAVFGLFSDLNAAQRAGYALEGNADWQVFATELTC
jgi:4-diphosphocytidyl-2-C-methyl-D-erythritol kinase